ncbi:MAG: phage tail tube protein [Sneathiellaceae bacterium]
MTLQSGVGTTIAYKAESLFGTAAGPSGGQLLRYNSSSLSPVRDSFQSSENRPDQQIQDFRLGTRRPAGSLETEIAAANLDALLGAALRGSWSNGVSGTESDFTSVTVDAGSRTATIGGGSFLATGFKTGDIVRFADLSAAGNNGRNLTVTALTATTMTFAEDVAEIASPDTAFTVAVAGAKLVPATARDSFTIEQNYPDIDVSEVFTGCRVNSATVKMPANGLAMATFGIMAKGYAVHEGAEAPYFTAPAEAPTNGLMELVTGDVFIDGARVAVVTDAEVSIALNMQADPVVGAQEVPEIFYGSMAVTGRMSIYLENAVYLQAFDGETELEVWFVLKAPGSEPQDFLAVRLHRIKATANEKSLAAGGGIVQSIPFQGLLRSGGSGTVHDTGSLVLQRGNPVS